MVAYGALRHGELKAGETLLVLGATGGVGSAAIQLGKALGASVIAVVSKPESASEVRDLGADHVTVLSDGPLAEAVQKLTDGKGANVVLDPLGGEFTGQAFSVVSKFGRLVHLGGGAGATLTLHSPDLVRNASAILGLNVFLQSPERLGKDHDERRIDGDRFRLSRIASSARPIHSPGNERLRAQFAGSNRSSKKPG